MELFDPRPKYAKNKLCTSKKVLFGTLIYSAVMFVVIVIVWAIFDRTDATGLAGIIAAPAAIAIGFYEWKAKAENLKKLEQLSYTEEKAERHIGFQSIDEEIEG